MLGRNEGKNNPMYGRKHSDETKRRIAESRKHYKGEKHPGWKGGKRITTQGYVEVLLPGHHRARGNNYVFEHILVAEEMIGRRLKKNEQVHHKNRIKTDNRRENLEILDGGEHSRIHARERRRGEYLSCVICSKEFYVKPSRVGRAKCCSLKCVGHYTNLKNKGELI